MHRCDYALCREPAAVLALSVTNDVAEVRPLCATHEDAPGVNRGVKLRTLIVSGTFGDRQSQTFDVKPEHTGWLPA